MPELPEVETVRKTLEPLLKGLTIESVSVYHPNMIESKTFETAIIGQTIHEINRIGKYLLFMLDDYVMISHLRMEGKYFLTEPRKKHPHEHVIFHLNNKQTLIYHDVRKFGRFQLRKKTSYLLEKPLSNLGPEPKDAAFIDIYHQLKKRHITIKQALLDQQVMAGLGNIYVDETLFRACIHPMKKTSSLTKKNVQDIVIHARDVLNHAVMLGGSTIRSYYATIGVDGKFQNELKVHTKKDQPCPVCQTNIIKIKVGGRGTYVCPKCQKK
jgi:formamidopyrimidine-DNA glycosylase